MYLFHLIRRLNKYTLFSKEKKYWNFWQLFHFCRACLNCFLSQLTGEALGVVFCGQSSPSYQNKAAWPFSSPINRESTFTYRTAAYWILFLRLFSVNPRGGCVGKSQICSFWNWIFALTHRWIIVPDKQTDESKLEHATSQCTAMYFFCRLILRENPKWHFIFKEKDIIL